jgi:hypothetical protein
MDTDQLFLATLYDIGVVLEHPGGEYAVLRRLAAPLRQVFLDGQRSLVSKVNDGQAVKLVFTVRADIHESIAGWHPIEPSNDERPTLDVDLDGFLERMIVNYWPDNDQMKAQPISVARLIKYLANVDGGVHRSRSDTAWQRWLEDYGATQAYETAHGRYIGPAFCLIGVAGVARTGLEPLRTHVEARTTAGRV